MGISRAVSPFILLSSLIKIESETNIMMYILIVMRNLTENYI